MKRVIKIKQVVLLLLCSLLVSCEDFLEVETPDHKIVSETVFNSDETAQSAMTGIYNQMSLAFFSSGGPESVTVLAGLSSDNLSPLRTNNRPYLEFEQHEIMPDNFRNFNLWSSAYNVIYMANSLLEGLENSADVSEMVREQLEGQARFVRAFSYFYLTNLYGAVPLLTTTDYRENALAARNSMADIYEQIQEDLQIAIDLLGESYPTGERTGINRYGAIALMARVQLYLQNWSAAEEYSSAIIDNTSTYELLEVLDDVFLSDSREAIWQLSPEGRGSILTNTNEGATLIINPFISFLSHLKLSDDFVVSFDEGDRRLSSWIGFDMKTASHFPFKYKIRNSTEEPKEYSMVLRLAEQYLIRAEANAMQNHLSEAVNDLDRIRARAGLEEIKELNPAISRDALLDLIMEERKRELFAEWGHRWLDLKRTGTAEEVLSLSSPSWESTDVLYPIPEAERLKNPNLTQNDGY